MKEIQNMNYIKSIGSKRNISEKRDINLRPFPVVLKRRVTLLGSQL